MIGLAGPKPPGPKYGQLVAPNLNVRQICPNCRTDPPNIIEEYSKGDLVCGDCGTILGDRIVDTRSEWRTFAGDEGGDDPSRVGDASNSLLTNNFETAISGLDGRTGISANLQRAQARANAASNIAGRTSNATLSAVFGRITEKCEAMQLPRNVVQRAQHVYKIADERRVVRGKNESAVIAACIIFASRDAGAARTMQEIGSAMKVSKKEIGHVFNLIKSAVQEDRQRTGTMQSVGGESVSRESVEALLGRYCSYLDLPNSILNASKHIATMAAAKAHTDGRSPLSIAGGALYFTCILFERPMTAKEIYDVGNVSESTIKLICKMIAVKLDEVIRPEWKDDHKKGYEALAVLGRSVNPSGKISRAGTPRANGTPTPTPNVENSAKVENGIEVDGEKKASA